MKKQWHINLGKKSFLAFFRRRVFFRPRVSQRWTVGFDDFTTHAVFKSHREIRKNELLSAKFDCAKEPTEPNRIEMHSDLNKLYLPFAATWQFRARKTRSGPPRAACFIFLVYRNNCETWHPRCNYPTTSTTRPFVRACSLAKSQKRPIVGATATTLHPRPRWESTVGEGRKKKGEGEKKKKRRPFIMELRNCKLSKYNGRAGLRGPRAPGLHFVIACAITGPLQHG